MTTDAPTGYSTSLADAVSTLYTIRVDAMIEQGKGAMFDAPNARAIYFMGVRDTMNMVMSIAAEKPSRPVFAKILQALMQETEAHDAAH